MMNTPVFTRRSAIQRAMPWCVVSLAIAVFANALANGFVLDAEAVILRNPMVHSIDGVWRAFANPYWPGVGGQYRPLVIASYSAEWAAWGARSAAFLALNLAWHATASVLVFLLARRWLSFGGAAIAAILFAVHPVHVEAVANAVGRAELMATTGVLAMLLLHERRPAWAVVAFAGALLSKEHALVAPVMVALLDVARPRPGESRASRERGDTRPSRWWIPYAGYGTVALAWAGAVAWVFRDASMAVVDITWRTMSAPDRWLTMLGAFPTIVRLWFAPFELSADYSPQVIRPWPGNTIDVAVGSLAIVAALAIAAVAWRRDRTVSVAVLWLLVAFAPVANLFIPTGVTVAERTLYLSSVGAVLLAGAVAEHTARRASTQTLAVVLAVAAAFAVRTWTRTSDWSTNRTLLLATAAAHPEASGTRLLLARTHARTGDHAAALREYRASLALFDRSPVAWSEAMIAAARSGNEAVADTITRQAQAAIGPHFLTSAARSGIALGRMRYAEALRAAKEAAVLAPDSARALVLEAQAWAGLGAPDSALAALARVPLRDRLRPVADSVAGRIRGGG